MSKQGPHDHSGRKAAPTAGTAQATALGKCFVRGHHDCLVCEHGVGVDHPLLVEAMDLLGDQLVAERELRAPWVDHALLPPRFAGASSRRSRVWLSSQISSSASLRFL